MIAFSWIILILSEGILVARAWQSLYANRYVEMAIKVKIEVNLWPMHAEQPIIFAKLDIDLLLRGFDWVESFKVCWRAWLQWHQSFNNAETFAFWVEPCAPTDEAWIIQWLLVEKIL